MVLSLPAGRQGKTAWLEKFLSIREGWSPIPKHFVVAMICIGRFSIGFSDDLIVCIDSLFECDITVFGATHGRKNSSALSRRNTFCLEYLHGIFSGSVIGWLYVCSLAHEKQAV